MQYKPALLGKGYETNCVATQEFVGCTLLSACCPIALFELNLYS